jgi:hypothetical protein
MITSQLQTVLRQNGLRALTINRAAFLEKLVMQGVQKRLYNQGVAQTDLKLQAMKACVPCFPHWDGITNSSHIALLFYSLLKKWVMGNMLYKQWVRQTTKVSVAGLHWIFTRLRTEHVRIEVKSYSWLKGQEICSLEWTW